ncbi:MAG TPA: hypothetical protein DD413_07655 [Ruminococcus sp.]|nr:hypothetical protein [Ruminococcus sp.]
MSEYSVNRCSRCGRQLTMEEDAAFHPPTCMNCAREHVSTIKKEMIKNIAISVVLMIVGIVIIQNPMGILLAGIPYGWSILNRITPAMFLWMSWVGWIVYFLIKLVIAYFIGIVALPIKLFQWISEIIKVKNLEKNIH